LAANFTQFAPEQHFDTNFTLRPLESVGRKGDIPECAAGFADRRYME
jgi:hypothetical protein